MAASVQGIGDQAVDSRRRHRTNKSKAAGRVERYPDGRVRKTGNVTSRIVPDSVASYSSGPRNEVGSWRPGQVPVPSLTCLKTMAEKGGRHMREKVADHQRALAIARRSTYSVLERLERLERC
ncbi:hypothetical protein CPLU01_02045 [Colletotrichum plurivorum]|uniref:Uncharacterized protein n=1 Tax=Colletotrichum plurivorum TaxID=2175906 RepID=A0A8H6KXF5_9PEZI|nr:hypothetical protein CPLU01_02045 [Colletotrichum plurivorum]